MHSAYANLVKSAKEVLCNINGALELRSPDIRCHVAGCTDKMEGKIKEE